VKRDREEKENDKNWISSDKTRIEYGPEICDF